MEWQPIETAPRDGTEFQGWGKWWEPRCRINPDTGAAEVWQRVDYDTEGWDCDWPHNRITHWMPLPAPPKEAE